MENSVFQGTPCKRKHDGKRYRANGDCVACTAMRTKQTWDRILAERREKRNAARRAKYASDPEWRQKQLAQSRAAKAGREREYRERRKKRYHTDPEYRAKIMARAAEKRARPEYKDSMRRYQRAWRYGLSHEQFEAMVAAQCAKCAICNSEERLVVDHCHSTDKVRGLLCVKCNAGLGQFAESDERLLAAAAYLRRYRAV